MSKIKCVDRCLNRTQCPTFGCLKAHHLWLKARPHFEFYISRAMQIPDKEIIKVFERLQPPVVSWSQVWKDRNYETLKRLKESGVEIEVSFIKPPTKSRNIKAYKNIKYKNHHKVQPAKTHVDLSASSVVKSDKQEGDWLGGIGTPITESFHEPG